MGIKNYQIESPGRVSGMPRIIYLGTTDTVETVTSFGYMERLVRQNVKLFKTDMALVTTVTNDTAKTIEVSWFEVILKKENDVFKWSLVTADTLAVLPDGEIFVGSVNNLAIKVPMSGDVTIVNTGITTISADAVTTPKIINDAVTTPKILDANVTQPKLATDSVSTIKIVNSAVTLPKLSAGITPSHIIKFAGKEASAGGSATIVIVVTGALATDIAFAQVQGSTTSVSVQKVIPATDQVTVILDDDPGVSTVISWQVLRVPS